MPAPEFLTHATEGWAKLYGTSKALSIGITFVHFSGLLLGGGSAVAADRETLKASREADPVRADHLRFLGTVHAIAVAGLVLLFVSGAAIFLSDLETFWDTKIFWVKMGLVALLLLNGLVMQKAERLAATAPLKAWPRLRTTSFVSLVLWFAVVLASTVLKSS